ncbi:MAG TPA: MoxR family ATPase [Myxococcota bacterium]
MKPEVLHEGIAALRASLQRTVVGQPAVVDELLVTLLARGHTLLEGVPGVAKTLLARAIAAAVDQQFGRVQFTPDLMPADLIGTRIYDPETKQWRVHRGPVFCEVLLADEINRTPPKTQAALLEAMEERQVTLDGERQPLPSSFFVVATQNPLEFEGTWPLPEAQTDRFLTKIVVGYPSAEAELRLLETGGRHAIELPRAVIAPAVLAEAQDHCAALRVDDSLRRYVLALVTATRTSSSLRLGASPRAGLMLVRAAQAKALLAGRAWVVPDDVKAVAISVLRHRLVLSTDAELDGLDVVGVIRTLLDTVPVLP